ncbi:MAG: RagB/SusD family nutrient uptake outer membrane protein [Flavobacteriales bacterium]|nr:MAG: RagB/SusD family nutrient uptake outer membrane protein [Flavobacteriales bacterium]
MKKIIYYIVLPLLFSLFACQDYLDLTQQGVENSDNYFNSENNAIYAVNGIYDLLQFDEGAGPEGQWVGGHFDFFLGDMTSDDAEKGSNDSDNNSLLRIIGGTGSPSLTQAESFWIHGFWGVSRANYVIEGLEDVTWDKELRDRLMGESLFLRAYFNWYLVRMFGPIPLFTSPVQPSDFGNAKRVSVNEVYTQIAEDLKNAATLLPTRSEYTAANMGRATKGAAQALLARIYMYQIGTDIDNQTVTWQDVYNLTNEVILSGEYKLLSNYAMLWETENDNSVEGVFEFQFGKGSEEYAPGSIGTNFNQYQGNRVDGSGWGFNNPTVDLVNAFENGDPRLSCTIYGESYNSGIVYGEKKKYEADQQGSPWLNRKAALPKLPSLPRAADRNIKIIRYADVLLMNAEAAYRLGKEGEAREKVNAVRQRARTSTYCMGYAEGKMDYSAAPANTNGLLPDISSSVSGDDLLKAIWHERRVELAMEQLRFYDLIRTGRFLDVMQTEKETERQTGGKYADYYSPNINNYFKGIKANLESKCYDGPNGNKVYVLPIPTTEVQSYGLEQNPGY